MFRAIRPTAREISTPRAGDNIVPAADVVMDRAFTLPGDPDAVWPWLEQLGKQRAGWYLPARLEALLPATRRASHSINAQWLNLGSGDVIPDYGGRLATFEVCDIERPHVLVFRSTRGRTEVSWCLTLEPAAGQTRVSLRLRLGPVRHRWVAQSVGGAVDVLTIAGLAAGLRERLQSNDC